MSNRHKRKGRSKFLMIEGFVKRSAAWKALTPIERCAYLEVKWRYDGTNNGRIGLGCRELGDELNMGHDTASRALEGLVEKGFIAKAKRGSFHVKNRAVSEWRLTEFACDVTGELPSKDFMRWGLEKKTRSDPSDTQSDPSDTSPAKRCKSVGHSPMDATVKPDFLKSQSDPSDTYTYTMRGASDAA